MLDSLLNIGCAFDWITPTFAFVQDLLYGPASHFGIPANSVWGRSDIKHLLNRYSIRVWGTMYNISGDMLMFSVSKTQSKWAYFLLQREGVPILYAPTEVISSPRKTKVMDPLDKLFNFLDKLEEDLVDTILK